MVMLLTMRFKRLKKGSVKDDSFHPGRTRKIIRTVIKRPVC